MNFTHLEAFLSVARAGSVSGGAERLNVSQPAVTREIKELEGRIGLILFDRLPRGVALTQAGHVLLTYAERIFALADAAESELRELAGLTAGQLAVGASATVGVYLIPDMIARFNVTYPQVNIELNVVNTELVEAGLMAQTYALGFIEGPYDANIFDAEEIGIDEIVIVASPSHPMAGKKVAATTLLNKQLILREPGSGTRAAVEEAYSRANLTIVPAMSISHTEAIKRMLLRGKSLAYLSRLSVADELRRKELATVKLIDFDIKRSLRMIWLKNRSFSPSTASFIALVREARLTDQKLTSE